MPQMWFDRHTRSHAPYQRQRIRGLTVGLIAAAIAGTIVVLWLFVSAPGSRIASNLVPPPAVVAKGALAADEQSTIELFEKSRASVVFVTTSQLVRDTWTRDVFAIPSGTGSGLIWDNAGHVVTNFHLIAGASEAVISLSDGRNFKAALVGASPEDDLAVLRIDTGADRPRPLPVGTSADLKVGQKVFAIGNPFGLDWTLTTGIISALDRSLQSERNTPPIEHLIQTDAAINPGNSGGPLLDSSGRLIGINTAIFSPSGASAGIGFAVPIDTVMKVVPRIIGNGNASGGNRR